MEKPSKRALIEQSIEGIFQLLRDIRREPGLYYQNEPILHALRSQGHLCALEYSSSIRDYEIKISPISLNTLKKKLLNNGPDRDFEHLDKLRIQAQAAIRKFGEEPAEPKKRSRSALEDQVNDLKKHISSLHATNMVLVQALEVNRRDLITILDTPNTGLRQKRIKDAITRIIRILGLNPAPFDDVTLLSTEKHLKLVSNEKKNS